MTLRLYFAHAGDLDETVTSGTLHVIFERWYVALGLLLLTLLIVIRLTLLVSRGSKPAAYTAVLVTLFFAGVATYTLSAPVSVVSLSLGFAMALGQVIFTLGDPHKHRRGEG